MAKRKGNTGRGVTANMLDLGSSDSGFESQRPDKKKQRRLFFACRGEEANSFASVWDSKRLSLIFEDFHLKKWETCTGRVTAEISGATTSKHFCFRLGFERRNYIASFKQL